MDNSKLQTPVFIVGIERSGSSIISKISEICGAFLGKHTGMYENIKINELISDYYRNLGIDTRGQFPLPKVDKLYYPLNLSKQVQSILEEERYKGKKIWVYKNSRVLQMWPVWKRAYPNAKWIIVRRRTGDILESCIKTGFMRAFEIRYNQRAVNVNNERDGWLWWVHQHEKLIGDLTNSGVDYKMVWPERMAMGDYSQISETLIWMGLKWSKDIVKKIEPMMWKSKQKLK